MGEWRSRIIYSEWKVVEERITKKNPLFMPKTIFHIEAKVWNDDWERFLSIDIDYADEGWGRGEANYIVELHNEQLKKDNLI